MSNESNKNARPQDLDDLIREYLTDGIISSKERAVLLHKAEQMGIDRDEMDLYIDAQQQKTDQKVEAAISKRRGKTCPFCGGTVPMLADKCPNCGEAITVESTDEFNALIKDVDKALADMRDAVTRKAEGYQSQGIIGDAIFGKAKRRYREACQDYENASSRVESCMRQLRLYYGNNPKVKLIAEELEREKQSSQKKAKQADRSRFIQKWGIPLGVGAVCFLMYAGSFFLESHDSSSSSSTASSSSTPSAQVDSAVTNSKEVTEEETTENEDDPFYKFEDEFGRAMHDGDLDKAKELLSYSLVTEDNCDKYDSYYKELIQEYLEEKDDFETAENLILEFRSNAGKNWKGSVTYMYAKKQYKKLDKDFEIIEDNRD